MGFKKSASIKVMPGVRVRVSSKGVSAYAGRTKIAGTSSASRTRRTTQPRSAPARLAPQPSRPVPPIQAVKPGVFAPKEEKSLYAYFVTRKDVVLDPAVMMQPVYAQTAFVLLGMQFMESGHVNDCIHALQNALTGPVPLESNNFINKYFPSYSVELEIAGGVSVRFPMSSDAISLALAEALQSQGLLDEAIRCVEEVTPTYPALLSLTELYSDKENWKEVIRLTDFIEVSSEVGALLAIMRSRAHLNLGQLTAAKECLKPLTASKKYSDNLRFQALALRSGISLEEKAYGRAIADLEKILAENSQIPGILQALESANSAKNTAEQAKVHAAERKVVEAEKAREAKKAETARLREEKSAEALRAREEKAAAAAKLREEKAIDKLARERMPVVQAGFISLSDDPSDDTTSEGDSSQGAQQNTLSAGTVDKEAGFYPDPEGIAPFRYWDGAAWTSRVRMKQ